jgi:hypothetical protein
MVRAAGAGFLPLSHCTLLMFARVFQVSVAVTAYVPGSSPYQIRSARSCPERLG